MILHIEIEKSHPMIIYTEDNDDGIRLEATATVFI